MPRRDYRQISSENETYVYNKKTGLIGKGNYGSVYQGYRNSDKIQVAIKILDTNYLTRKIQSDKVVEHIKSKAR